MANRVKKWNTLILEFGHSLQPNHQHALHDKALQVKRHGSSPSQTHTHRHTHTHTDSHTHTNTPTHTHTHTHTVRQKERKKERKKEGEKCERPSMSQPFLLSSLPQVFWNSARRPVSIIS